MTIASFSMPATTTLLGSVAGIHVGDPLACQSSLVLQEGFQLEPTPTSENAVELASQLLLLFDVQLLKHEGVERKGNDLFADAMVNVSNETVFLSAELLQSTLSRL